MASLPQGMDDENMTASHCRPIPPYSYPYRARKPVKHLPQD